MKKDNILIYVLMAAGAFYFIKKNGENNGAKNTNENFKALKANLKTDSSNPVLVVSFNGGKNRAQYYNNDRVIILDANLKRINAGKYSDGGLTITLDNGTTAQGASVTQTLLKTF